MNWLAHIFLSEQNIDFQMGNYLADPLKGKAWEDASYDLKKGIEVHMIIDSFTDAHEIVKQSKSRLRDTGLLKSIVIDITYDYFLSKNWDRYCHIAFEEFTSNFYKNASNKLEYLPENASVYIEKIIKFNILNKYQKIEHIEKAFGRFDKRLSQKLLSRDSTSSYFKAVEKNIDLLEKDFLEFFPQLCQKVIENVDSSKVSHFKI